MIFKDLSRVSGRIKSTAATMGATVRVSTTSRYLSGPRKIRLGDDDVAVVCMLKNGSYYIDAFIEHHRAIGIQHFLFIDNGSQDDTVEKLASYADVTTIANTLPVAKYESFLRSQIARKVISGGWFLFVDSDELIEMINGTNRRIHDYARYCNEYGYDAVVGQALDLFSCQPLAETSTWKYEYSIREFNQFSLSNIDNYDYYDSNIGFSWFLRSNRISNPLIKIKFGGIRRELFGENCALTNHRMVRNSKYIELYSHPHCSSRVHCADFTLLLRHYKFAGPYIAREKRQSADRVWGHGEDRRRLAVIQDSSFTFSGKDIRRFNSASQLIDQGFMTISGAFLSCFPAPTFREGTK